MNKVIMIGRLTKDIEIRTTQSGKKVGSFSIAVDDGKKDGVRQAQFFNCTAWERTAEIMESYTTKGVRVCVVGRLQNRSWDKPDGTKGYATDITATEIEILSSKSESEVLKAENASAGPQKQSTSSNDKPQAGGDDVKETSLPEINVDELNVQMPF